MEKNTVYINTKINALHNEINDLRNRQIVMEVQLTHTLEKTKMHHELREKCWHEFGIWTRGFKKTRVLKKLKLN